MEPVFYLGLVENFSETFPENRVKFTPNFFVKLDKLFYLAYIMKGINMRMKNTTTILLLVGLVVGLSLAVAMVGEEGTSEAASLDESTFWSSVPEKYVTTLQVFRHFYSTDKEELWFELQLVLADKTTVGQKVSSLLRVLLRPEDRDVPYFFLVRLYKPRSARGGEIRLEKEDLNLLVDKKLYGVHGDFSLIGERGILGYGMPELTPKNPSELVVFVPSSSTTKALKKAISQGNKVRIYYEDTQGAELKLPE